MTDSNLSALDVVVFGGPTTVDLSVDFGPQGTRGSRITAITNDPRLSTTIKPLDSVNGDILLNVTTGLPDSLMMYQKNGVGNEDWQELVKLYPNIYSAKLNKTFANGEVECEIVLNEVFTKITDYDVSKFMVQHNVEDLTSQSPNFPMATSVSLSVAPDGSDQVLTITIKAVEFQSGQNPDWVPINGARTIHLLVTAL
jgi:hypothetical protein